MEVMTGGLSHGSDPSFGARARNFRRAVLASREMNLRRMLRGATLAFALTPSAGFAQALGENDRRARVDLLSRADEARRGGRLDEALGLIRQAEAIGQTAGTGMLSAQVLSQMGRSASAYAAAERCLRAVDLDRQTTEANLSRIRDECSQRRDEALLHASRFTVRVPSDAPSALVVRVNGTVLLPSLYNVEQVVDSVVVNVSATVPGHAPWQRAATLAAGARLAVDVELPSTATAVTQVREASPPPTTVPPDGTTGPQDMSAHPGSTQRALAWVGAGLGAVGLGVGIWATAANFGRRDEYDQQCAPGYPIGRMAACNALLDRVSDASVVAPQMVGFAAAGAFAVTSAVLFATAPSLGQSPSSRVFACGPWMGTIGVDCGGRF